MVKFQFKLIADGFRDLVFSPLSLAAGIIGLMIGGDEPDRYFRKLLRLGRRTDVWINLFGAYRGRGSADALLAKYEARALAELNRDGMLDRMDRTLGKLDVSGHDDAAKETDRTSTTKKPDHKPGATD